MCSNLSEEYVKKKEAARELKRVKHLTAKQAARKKDNEMWEKNRMIRSGLWLVQVTIFIFLNTGSSAGDSDYLDPNFFPKSGIQSFTRADSIVKKALKNHDW